MVGALVALGTPPLISPIACGEITLRRLIRRGGPLSVTPAAAAVSNAVSRLSGMDERERAVDERGTI